MLTPAEAEERIARNLSCLPIESLPVGQCAGAILRENVYAERDQPPFDRVAMDGIALVAGQIGAGRRSFAIQATQAAGDPPLTLISPEHCIETGPMPHAWRTRKAPVVQFETATPSVLPHRTANLRSNSSCSLPPTTQPLRTTAAAASASASPKYGGEKEMGVLTERVYRADVRAAGPPGPQPLI